MEGRDNRVTGGCQPRVSAAAAARLCRHQGCFKEVVQRLNGVPGGFVAQADLIGRPAYGAQVSDRFQQHDPLGPHARPAAAADGQGGVEQFERCHAGPSSLKGFD